MGRFWKFRYPASNDLDNQLVESATRNLRQIGITDGGGTSFMSISWSKCTFESGLGIERPWVLPNCLAEEAVPLPLPLL